MQLNEITAAKRITVHGNSLVVKVTAEVKALGLDRNDWVEVTIRKLYDVEDGEEE